MFTYSFTARGCCSNPNIKTIKMSGRVSSNLEKELEAFWQCSQLALEECKKLEPTFYISSNEGGVEFPTLRLLKNKS